VIAPNSGKFMGIRNGIDIDIWDPMNDQFLPRGYSAETVVEGKAAARDALRSRLGLTGWGDKPVIGVVTRLTKQKGADCQAFFASCARMHVRKACEGCACFASVSKLTRKCRNQRGGGADGLHSRCQMQLVC
jgi:hypothetical protein